MALFSANYNLSGGTGKRLTGIQRYRELLSRDYKRFFLVNLLTLAGFLPFVLGVLISILSSSVLVLIPACILGGVLAGSGKCMANYKRAWKQNWRQSILPGMIFCLLLGFYTFMLMTFWWAMQPPGIGTIAIYLFGLALLTMFFSLYWPQIALFEQSGKQRFQNCLLFLIRFFFKTLGCALLQVLYWAVIALFLPWSVILLPFTGVWFILFTANFLLYDTMNDVFGIEEQIARAFPEQAAFYEDDETWLKRKQETE